MASANQGQNGAKHTSGYGLAAAVTATPTTRNERPVTTRQSGSDGWSDGWTSHRRLLRVIRSPTPTPSASAKPASTTTPPSRTQLPWVSFGRSTEPAAASRPTAQTPAPPPTTSPLGVLLDPAMPSVSSSIPTTGYGPLWSTTPGASVRAVKPERSAWRGESGPTLATT